jgi:carboxylesterase type B
MKLRTSWMRTLAITSALILPYALACAQVVVHTNSGALQGVSGNGTVVFKGIPLAEPPVGDLRLQTPLPPKSWLGIRQANEPLQLAAMAFLWSGPINENSC